MEPVNPFRDRAAGDASGVGDGAPTAGGDTERDRLTALLRSVAKGDDAAFATVYDETAARVHGLVLRVLRNPAQAEEVTQEVYLEVWRQASRFDPGRGSPFAWLMTMAHRRAVDRVRSSQSASTRDETWEARTRDVEFDSRRPPPGWTPSGCGRPSTS